MMGSDERRFALADELLQAGNFPAAIEIYVDLCRRSQAEEIRLRSALTLMERLNLGRDVELMAEVASIGMQAATAIGEIGTRAYLMGQRAKCEVVLNGSLALKRRNLRLAPGWVAFSLEVEERQYKEITAAIEAHDNDADRLIREALGLTNDPDVQNARGHIMMCAGNIAFQRYMTRKIDSVSRIVSVPTWLLNALRSYALDEWVLYKSSDRAVLRGYMAECEQRYMDAVKIFRAADDDLNAGYALFNLANDLRSAYRFRRARQYLQSAKKIATTHQDQQLLKNIGIVAKSIRRRNRDVPNYLAGEQRSDEAW